MYTAPNNCIQCGKDKNSNPRFCSRSCSITFSNAKRGDASRKHCGFCGALTLNLIYCSYECASNAKKAKSEQLVYEGFGNNTAIRRLLMRSQNGSCASCKNDTWLCQPITLELHHKNGNSGDKSLDNHELLCPNCHSFTDNFKAKNKGNGRYSRKMRYREGKSH